MDQVTKVRSRIKREQWKNIITECRNSGMTVRAWCEANGIVEQTYYRNLKRLREDLLENISVPAEESERPVPFKRLEVQTPIPDTHAAVIIHLNGIMVEITEGASQQTIQAVLLALQSVL